MTRICAWCRNEMPPEEGRDSTPGEITHGICPDCLDNIQFQQGVELESYLDSLPAPVLLVDSEGNVLTGNRVAEKAFSTSRVRMKGMARGLVYECPFARLPEGCGRTVHCSGCAIRRAILQTLETGSGLVRVRGYVDGFGEEKDDRWEFLISTALSPLGVLLLMEPVGQDVPEDKPVPVSG